MKVRPLFLVPLLFQFSPESRASALTLTGSAGNLLVSGSGATAVTGNAFADGDTLSYTGTPAAAFTISVTGNIVPGAVSLANTTNTITFGGTSTVTGTTYTKTGTGAVYFNTGMSFSGGISTGSGFSATTTAGTGNGLASQTGTLASLELFSLTTDAYNLTGPISLTNTVNANVLAFGGLGSGVNASKTLSNNITLSANAVQSRFVILGDANTNTAQAGKHDVVLSGKISGGVTGATFFINTDQSGSGASALKLTNATNDFIANINVNRGGLAITSDAALGNSANNVTIDSNNTNGGMRFDAALTSARTFTFTVNEAVDTNGNDVTLSGIVAGAGTLTKKSGGTLTLSGTSANTFSSALVVNAGTVKLGKASALGTTAGNTSVTSGAVLDLNGQTIGAEPVTLNGSGISSGGALINSNTTTAASLSGAVTLGSNSSAGGAGNLTLSGAVGGAFTLTKVGAGSLTLSTANTFSATTISNGPDSQSTGAIVVGNNAALGSGAVTLNNTARITALFNGAASSTLANNIALSSTAGITTRFLAGNATTFQLDGVISGGSATSVFLVDTNQGAGSTGLIKLTGANTFQGKVQINRGGLAIASDSALGDSANTILFDIGTATQAGLRFDASMSSARAIQLGGSKQVFDTNSNDVTLSGVISGTGDLYKSSGGKLTISNANTYAGITTVAAGSLSVTGSLSSSVSAVTVQTGATLNVTGTISRPVTIDSGGTLNGNGGQFNSSVIINGTHSPGASPGLQSFSNGLTYGSTSALNVELVGDALGVRGTDYDGLNLTGGSLTIDPASSFNLIASGIDYAATIWDANRNFTIIDLSGSASLAGGLFALNTASAGSFSSEGTWSLSSSGGDVVLNWTAVPEPGAALLGGIGTLILLRRRRR